jgi:putative FmdB family regulatory protein
MNSFNRRGIVQTPFPRSRGDGTIQPSEEGNGSAYNSVRGAAMPVYEYHCDKCNRAVTISLSIREHDKGTVQCPKCGSKALRPLLSTFMSQTSKKS